MELKVDQDFTYTKAIKACLRQLPEWILLSEARSVEVKYLLESMSTGTHCLTTLHTDDVRKIPDRIKNMMPQINEQTENDIYSFINVGIQVRSYITEEGIQRKIAQIALFSRDLMSGKNSMTMLYNEGAYGDDPFPDEILWKFASAGIDPRKNYPGVLTQ